MPIANRMPVAVARSRKRGAVGEPDLRAGTGRVLRISSIASTARSARRRRRGRARPSPRRREAGPRRRGARRRRGRPRAAAARPWSRRSPAHLADELRAVSAQAPSHGRETQRMLGGEVQLHVADVAGANALGPKRLHRLTEQLLPRIAEQLFGERVHEHDPPVMRGGHDRVRAGPRGSRQARPAARRAARPPRRVPLAPSSTSSSMTPRPAYNAAGAVCGL